MSIPLAMSFMTLYASLSLRFRRFRLTACLNKRLGTETMILFGSDSSFCMQQYFRAAVRPHRPFVIRAEIAALPLRRSDFGRVNIIYGSEGNVRLNLLRKESPESEP